LRQSQCALPLLHAWETIISSYRATNIAQIYLASLAAAISQLPDGARVGLTDALVPVLARLISKHDTLEHMLATLAEALMWSPNVLFIQLLLEVDAAFPLDAERLFPFIAQHLITHSIAIPLREQLLRLLVDKLDRRGQKRIGEMARLRPNLAEQWTNWRKFPVNREGYLRINRAPSSVPDTLVQGPLKNVDPIYRAGWEVVRDAYTQIQWPLIRVAELAMSIEQLPTTDRAGLADAFIPKFARMIDDEQILREMLDALGPVLVRSREVLFMQLLLYWQQNSTRLGEARALRPYFAVHLTERTASYPLREHWLRLLHDSLGRGEKRDLDDLMKQRDYAAVWKQWKERRPK
jgi:hypothetical protein